MLVRSTARLPRSITSSARCSAHQSAPLPRITSEDLVRLKESYSRACQNFSSYNFKHYFLRKSRKRFGTDLLASIGTKDIERQQTLDLIFENEDTSQAERLNAWYRETAEELKVLERASVMNQLFEAPKLVVEGLGNVLDEGGVGARVEQAPGGAGHDEDSIRIPFPRKSSDKS